MKIRQFQAFQAVMQMGSTVAAAELLHSSQPAISRLIADLECHLDLKLFDRTGRKLEATPEAILLLPEVERWFDGMRSIDSITSDIKQQVSGFLRVTSIPAVIGIAVVPSVADMSEINQAIKVDLSQGRSATIHQQLRWNQIDVGVAGPPFEGAEATLVAVISAPCVCVMAREHPLAQKHIVRISDLANERQVAYVSDLVLQKRIEAEFQSRGIRQKIVCATPQSQIACQLIAKHVGVSILEPFSVIENAQFGLVAKPVDPTILFALGVFVNKSRQTEAARDLANKIVMKLEAIKTTPGISIERFTSVITT